MQAMQRKLKFKVGLLPKESILPSSSRYVPSPARSCLHASHFSTHMQMNVKKFGSMVASGSSALGEPLLQNTSEPGPGTSHAAGVGPLQRDMQQAALIRKHRSSANRARTTGASPYLQSAATSGVGEDKLATAAASRPSQAGPQEIQEPSTSPAEGGDVQVQPPSTHRPPSPPSPQSLTRRCSGDAVQPATLAEGPSSHLPHQAQLKPSAAPDASTSGDIPQAVPIAGLAEELSGAAARNHAEEQGEAGTGMHQTQAPANTNQELQPVERPVGNGQPVSDSAVPQVESTGFRQADIPAATTRTVLANLKHFEALPAAAAAAAPTKVPRADTHGHPHGGATGGAADET